MSPFALNLPSHAWLVHEPARERPECPSRAPVEIRSVGTSQGIRKRGRVWITWRAHHHKI